MLTESVNNDNPSVLPVVPMKPLSQCKTRLERIMGPQDREDLTIGMLRRVLLAIRGAGVDPVLGDWRRRPDSQPVPDAGRGLDGGPGPEPE